jgi:hypothetical protein
LKVWFGNGGSKVPAWPASVLTVYPDAEDVALLEKEERRLLVEAGAVGTVGADVEEILGAGAPAPAGVEQHPGAARNAAMEDAHRRSPSAGDARLRRWRWN